MVFGKVYIFLYLGIAGSKAMLPAIYLPPVVHFKGCSNEHPFEHP